MKRRAVILPLAIFITAFVIMLLLLSFRDDQSKRSPEPRSKRVAVMVAHPGVVQTTIPAYGRLTSAQPVKLVSEVSGTLIEGEIPFLPAQSFRKGDLLVKIDDRQIGFELNSTKSDLLAALASVLPEIKVDFHEEFAVWQEYFTNCSFDKPLPPLPEASNRQIKLFLARFNVYKLYFTARNLEILFEKHYFIAPFRGSILTTDLRVGSSVRTGTNIGEIINLEDMEVEVPIPAGDIEWIDHRHPVLFTSTEISGTWQGRIKRIGSSIDERTQSVPVFLSVEQSEGVPLLTGVFLKADIPCVAIENAITIPRKALYEGTYVYMIVDGKLKYQEVEIARRGEDSVVVTGGISASDSIVVEVMQGVSPGMLAEASGSDPSERIADE